MQAMEVELNVKMGKMGGMGNLAESRKRGERLKIQRGVNLLDI